MNWASQPCLAYDVETTGISVHEDRIVTASLVRIVPGKDPVTFNWLADPGVEIPDEAAAIHGITTEKARAEGAEIGQVLFEVAGQIAWAMGRGIPLVAFNAAFDLSILEAECARHRVPTLAERLRGVEKIRPVIDPMVLDKYADPYRKGICPCGCGAQNKQLVGVCAHYGVTLEDAHTSSADALAAGALWAVIMDRYPAKFRGLNLAGLHQGQTKWRRDQMDSLRAYFVKQGTPHDGCPGDWPLLPARVSA